MVRNSHDGAGIKAPYILDVEALPAVKTNTDSNVINNVNKTNETTPSSTLLKKKFSSFALQTE